MRLNSLYLLVFILVAIFFAAYWTTPQNSLVNDQNIFAGSKDGLTEFQKDIVKKFREGNVAGLAEYFDKEVSITILKVSDFYTKDEAENVLLEFCQNHTSKKFLVKHYGVNPAKTSYYLIGEMTTTAKEKFRVYVSNSETKIENIEITIPREL